MERRALSIFLAIASVLPGLACASGGMRQLKPHDAHDSYAYASRAVNGRIEPTLETQLAGAYPPAPTPWAQTAAPVAMVNGCDPRWPLVTQPDGTALCEPPATVAAATPGAPEAMGAIEITAAPPAR